MKRTLAEQELLTKIVRPELNIERWPSIWMPAQSRSLPKLRILERKKTLENGDVILSKVTINPSLEYGNLTTQDQKVWYGLIELWHQAGKPQILIFSLSQLAKILGRTWSSKTLEALKNSLMRLNISMLTWVNSYYDSTTKKTLELVDSFQIIARLQLATISEEHTLNSEQCLCQFSEPLYQNLLNNYTKPTLFYKVLYFKSGVAQLVYKYLELVMNDKNYFERNSKELFEDIGLEGEEYKRPIIRKRVLSTVIIELNEIPIVGGTLIVSLVETKDKSDWKLVVQKISNKPNKVKDTTTEKLQKETELPLHSSDIRTKVLSLTAEMTAYFLERFGIKRDKATKKEVEQVSELIDEYQLDLEQGKYLIDFAKAAAQGTKYQPQHFSGIIQYAGVAIKEYKAKNQRKISKTQADSCSFCNGNGFIGVIDATGKQACMQCPHSAEVLKVKAAREGIKFEFWVPYPPKFEY